MNKKNKPVKENGGQMLAIEKNIPIPTMQTRQSRVYPFTAMKVGDSFFAEGCDKSVGNKLRSSTASFCKRREGYTFTVRKVEGGYRVWRL